MFVAGIERFSIVDGDGWRYTIFFQGCNHKCKGCHNPETWEFNVGKSMSVEDILNDIETCDAEHLEDITFSGGDPFYQAGEIITLAKALKEKGFNIWAYTGFVFDDFMKYMKSKTKRNVNPEITDDMIELLNYIDIVVDGPFILDKRSLEIKYRGSTNQRLIDVRESLAKHKIIEYKLED